MSHVIHASVRTGVAILRGALDFTGWLVSAVLMTLGLFEILLRGCVLLAYLAWLVISSVLRVGMRGLRWLLG